ncbi:rod shape-determining protein [Streptomyces virginiae]|uniref:rod shape-determining protein n=1 Tax=Streptomyces virginiae TaxID=1961 RepID=UPI003330C7B1
MGINTSFIGCDMAVDLGTTNTLVYVWSQGIVLNEPSVVAINAITGDIMAVGAEARKAIGREPGNAVVVRPLKNGVIADFEVAERMLRYFILKVHKRRWVARPRLLVCVPSDITGIERRAFIEASTQAGARQVHVISEPMAAAIGAGLPVHEATGNMVVNIGGGTTQVAVISFGEIVNEKSIRVGGDELDETIIQHVKKEYSLLLGESTAEHIKVTIGSVSHSQEDKRIEIYGRDLISGLPNAADVSAAGIRRAMEQPVSAMINVVQDILSDCSPELSGDIISNGITLTGGGSLLHGLDTRLHHETGIPFKIADNPMSSAAFGAGRCVEKFGMLQILTSRRHR